MENSVTKEEFNNALNNINSNIVGTENNITNNLIGTKTTKYSNKTVNIGHILLNNNNSNSNSNNLMNSRTTAYTTHSV